MLGAKKGPKANLTPILSSGSVVFDPAALPPERPSKRSPKTEAVEVHGIMTLRNGRPGWLRTTRGQGEYFRHRWYGNDIHEKLFAHVSNTLFLCVQQVGG